MGIDSGGNCFGLELIRVGIVSIPKNLKINKILFIGLEVIGLEMIWLEIIGLEMIGLETIGLDMIGLDMIGLDMIAG